MSITEKMRELSKLRGCLVGDIEREVAQHYGITVCSVTRSKQLKYKTPKKIDVKMIAQINEYLIKKIEFFKQKRG